MENLVADKNSKKNINGYTLICVKLLSQTTSIGGCAKSDDSDIASKKERKSRRKQIYSRGQDFLEFANM